MKKGYRIKVGDTVNYLIYETPSVSKVISVVSFDEDTVLYVDLDNDDTLFYDYTKNIWESYLEQTKEIISVSINGKIIFGYEEK